MKGRYVVIGVFVAALGLTGWTGLRHFREKALSVLTKTTPVTRGPLEVSVSATGSLEPLTKVEVRSRSGGQVRKILVDAGDFVRTGQPIAQIDPTDLRSGVDQASAQLASTAARLEQARVGTRSQTTQTTTTIAEASAGLLSAQARFKQAETQLSQTERSTEQSVVRARAQLASAQARLRQARLAEGAQPEVSRTAIAAAQAGLRSARERLVELRAGSRPQEVAQARARLRQAEASARNTDLTLQRQERLLAQGFLAKQVVDDARLAAETAAAQAEDARQALALALQGPREEEIRQGEAAVEQAQAQLESATAQNYQLDVRVSEREAAQASVDDAKAALASAEADRSQVALRAQDIAAARQAIAQAEAVLRRAQSGRLTDAARQLDVTAGTADLRRAQSALNDQQYSFRNSTIVAPRSGVILEKFIEEGTIIPAGSAAVSQGTTIMTIADTTRMFVLARVDEADVAPIKLGMSAEVQVEALPDLKLTGKVVRIFPKSQMQDRAVQFPVRVEITNPPTSLRPGMTADIKLTVDRRDDCLQVRDAAITRSEGKTTVKVVKKLGTPPVEREIQLGITDWDHTEVISGLEEGEEVVLPLRVALGVKGEDQQQKGGF